MTDNPITASILLVINGHDTLKTEFMRIAEEERYTGTEVLAGQYREWLLNHIEEYEDTEDHLKTPYAEKHPETIQLLHTFMRSAARNLPEEVWEQLAQFFLRRIYEREQSNNG